MIMALCVASLALAALLCSTATVSMAQSEVFYVCREYPCYPKHDMQSLNGFWDFSFSTNISDPTDVDLSRVGVRI